MWQKLLEEREGFSPTGATPNRPSNTTDDSLNASPGDDNTPLPFNVEEKAGDNPVGYSSV
jgi:hypothetical protein